MVKIILSSIKENMNADNDCAEIKLNIDEKDKDRFEMFMAYTYQKYVKNINK